jgi:chromosomal replication initiation ATPase DnaA
MSASTRRAALLADLAKLHARAMQIVADLAALDADEQQREQEREQKREQEREQKREKEREREEAATAKALQEQARLPERIPFEDTRDCDIADVIGAVSGFYRLTPLDLRSQDRHRDIAHARHVAFYLCRKLPGRPGYPTIGRAFGDRDHTTVISGVKKIAHKRTCDPLLNAQIDVIAGRLGLLAPTPPPAEAPSDAAPDAKSA